MSLKFLHHHASFTDLIRIVAAERNIADVLVEKDYWIMHCLYGLQKAGLSFELKGGTSLSKGFGIIDRFSEDIDIRIEPPEEMEVASGRNHDKPAQIESRRQFYEYLSTTIRIDGITRVERDMAFDSESFRSGGIRLIYEEVTSTASDLKNGILLEVGFDDVTPNIARDISSWAYDYAMGRVDMMDNRALGVLCYHPGYTLVEKLQAISTKFRKQQLSGKFPANFMRHYYDVYALLVDPMVLEFIGTPAYVAHKERRFRSENRDIEANEAFNLAEASVHAVYEDAYNRTQSLYYHQRPSFDQILARIKQLSKRL